MVFSKGKITFNRGDDDALMVALNNGDVFHLGDKVFFSIKADPTDTVDVLQIESTMFVPYLNPVTEIETIDAAILVTIPHEATIGLTLGKYFYDVLIEWADGTYVTVVNPTTFDLVAGGSHVE